VAGPSFELTYLDLRGFVDVGIPQLALWSLLSPVKLKSLTLHVGPTSDVSDCSEFWVRSIAAGLRPEQLSTNLVVHGLEDFIHSFSGLSVFSITAPKVACQPEPLSVVLDALWKQHATTLKVLSINPLRALSSHQLNDVTLIQMMTRFTKVEELQFGMPQAVPVRILRLAPQASLLIML
jgi:hypothetical protein